MYKFDNYLLSMQSHWMVHQPVYEAAQASLPLIARYQASRGTEDLEQLPIKSHIKKLFPDIYRAPLLRRQYCKMLVEEIKDMKEMGLFEVNDEEDQLRQIPEIVLKDKVPELYRTMFFCVRSVLQPIFFQLYQRYCADIASIQLANYNIRDKQQGAWHHDESADISVVVPLNSGDYDGGGTEFHGAGKLKPLPTGHALIFPSFTKLHRGLPVARGDRYLLVFWLYDRDRLKERTKLLLSN